MCWMLCRSRKARPCPSSCWTCKGILPYWPLWPLFETWTTSAGTEAWWLTNDELGKEIKRPAFCWILWPVNAVLQHLTGSLSVLLNPAHSVSRMWDWPLFIAHQGDGEAEWIHDGELCVESVLHPGWDSCPRGSPVGWQERFQRPWNPTSRLSRSGCPTQSAVWHPTADLGPHTVCRGNYRQGRRHYSQYHQTDPLKVRTERSEIVPDAGEMCLDPLFMLLKRRTMGKCHNFKWMISQDHNENHRLPLFRTEECPAVLLPKLKV